MADVIAGRYVLLSSLGRGGMGEVFLADDLVLGRRVAIKRILAGSALDRVAIERLIREARLAATLHHPHVVAVHDLVTDGDRTHIVMEFVDSRSLAEMIRAKKQLEPPVVGRIGGQIASALEAAHRAGIIHRDVKPSNILVNDHQVAKLADFGVARSAGDPSLTGTGMMIGSVAFMAPEIARGEDVTPAADIYSLGATMYAAIEGHAPFASEAEPSSSMRMLARLITESAPYATHGGSFAGLIRRMMASDPADRPTAGEVQRSLAVLTAGPTPQRQVTREEVDGGAPRVNADAKQDVPTTAPALPGITPGADATATVLRGSLLPPVTATPAVPSAAPQLLVAAARGASSPKEGDTPTQLRNPAATPIPAPDSLAAPAAAPPANPKKKRLLLVAIGAAVLVLLAGTLTAIRWAGVLNGVTALATGGSHTCALDQDGKVRCWGSNATGQLGDGTTDQHAKPVVTDVSGVTTLSAGDSHACAITQDGQAHCWGDNYSGQLGDGTTDQRTKPVTVKGLDGVTALATGGSHTCAITQDGQAHCWGANDSGQLGDGTTDQRTKPVTVKGLDGVTALATGGSHTCAITQDGQAHCWGANYSGQLGDGTSGDDRINPVTVPSLTNVTALTTGGAHSCALTHDGHVRCWGNNTSGQLGDGTTAQSTTPLETSLTSTSALAAGDYHACALTHDGHVHCWGANYAGQLGDGTTDQRSKPVDSGLTDVTALSAGSRHTCALTHDGHVHCWGANESGQLGDGTTDQSTTPVTITGLDDVTAIATGDAHSCALTLDGQAHCWGDNTSGQLGDDTTDQRTKPVAVTGLSDITALTAGGEHTCALSQDGKAHCWGANYSGQLGDGTTDQRTKPATVTDLSDVTGLATGLSHTCALTLDRKAHCWGNNDTGQLGDDTTTEQRTKPVTVTELTDVTALSARWSHTCAITQDGKAHCWGANDSGQLGDGTIEKRTKPVTVTELTDVTWLSAGGFHTCALTHEGHVACWGHNGWGQLGDDNTNRLSPVTVVS